MKRAKNDKTTHTSKRIQARERSHFSRLIVALCLTGSFFADEAYSQAPSPWKSSAYTSRAVDGLSVQVRLDDRATPVNSGRVVSPDGNSDRASSASFQSPVAANRNRQKNRRVIYEPPTIPKNVPIVSQTNATPSREIVMEADRRRTNVPNASVAPVNFVPSDVARANVPDADASPANSVPSDVARANVPNVSSAANAAQVPPKQLQEAAATLQGTKSLETLETAMRIALEESRTQRALALKKDAARSNADAARSLANPKITNATSYVGLVNRPTLETGIDLSDLGGLVPPGIPLQFQTESVLADREFATSATAVTIPLYLGGRVQALTREAEAMVAAIEAGEDVGEQAVKSETSEAYFLVLRTRKLHEVALEGVQTTQAHLDDARRALDVGIVTRNVVLAAQVANAEAKQLELRVANAQNLAEAAYNRVLWRPLDTKVEITDAELGAPLGDLDALTIRAVRTRAELRVLQHESRAMQEQEKVARADVLPQVVATGAYLYHENEALKDNSNGTAAVGIVWTPFDGGTSRARQNAARQNAMSISRTREETESAIRLQVRQAWLAEREARERVEVARTAVEQAEENLRVVTRGFQEGLVNHTEVLDASTMNTAAKSNFANAKYDAILATQRLKFAVGIL